MYKQSRLCGVLYPIKQLWIWSSVSNFHFKWTKESYKQQLYGKNILLCFAEERKSRSVNNDTSFILGEISLNQMKSHHLNIERELENWAHEYQSLILHLQFLQVNEQCWDTESPKLFTLCVCVCVCVCVCIWRQHVAWRCVALGCMFSRLNALCLAWEPGLDFSVPVQGFCSDILPFSLLH